MSFEEGMEILQYAMDADVEDKLYLRWINGYQSSMGFDEFKSKLTVKNAVSNDNRTAEEILDHVEKMMEAFNGNF